MTQTADQLAKQSQQLEAREAYIAAQEKIAEDTAKAIEKAKRELALLDSTIKAREEMLGQQRERQQQQDKLYASSESKLADAIEREQRELERARKELTVVKAEIELIKTAIQDRTAYQQQQEEHIAEQAEAGNVQLKSVAYEIAQAKQELKDLEQDIQDALARREELTVSIQSARNDFAPELDRHEADVLAVLQRRKEAEAEEQAVKDAIQELKQEQNKLLTERQQIHADVDAKLKILDTREREIMAKREAIEQERIRAAEADHYRTTTNSLYGVN